MSERLREPVEPRAGYGPAVARVGVALLAAGLVGCDHATKIAAKAALAGGPVPVVDGVLELRYAANDDTAFSVLHNVGVARTGHVATALVAAALLALALVLVAWWRASAREPRPPVSTHIGFALIVAGALGNVADRALRGYVVDFIHVTGWPIFNVADIAVVAGIGLLALASLRRRPRATLPPAAPG